MRADYFTLKQGKMAMRDYVQKDRHLVSCIVTNPIAAASQIHVFVCMCEGMTRYCITRAEPKSLEEAFALAMREDYTVSSSYSRALASEARVSAPEPMAIDAIEATNNRKRPFYRGGRQPATTVRDYSGEMIVKLAEGKPRRMSRREVVLPYMFDGFQSVDTFMVIETNHAFDCTLGMLWLARYQPKINWLARSVKRRSNFDMSEGFTHLLVSPRDWPHVTVVDQLSTTQSMHRASDGPLCVACSAVVHDVHGWRSRGDISVEQGLPHANEMKVEQGPPHANEMTVEQGLPYDDSTGEVDHDLLRLEDVATPPKDAKSNIQLPVISWKHFLRDLKASEIEQTCLITDADSVPPMVNATSASDDISTFCVKKSTGGWRIVHAFNKLNDATIPAQTRIPRKDMVLDSMSGGVIYSDIDLTDGFYQILMRECDVPLTAVRAPSGMLWECLVMPQGLKNAPATFNRMVSHVLRPLRDFAPSYFDDRFVHRHAEGDLSAVDVHLKHLRQVFQVMRDNKPYANLKKCIFCAPEIQVLGCYVSKNGVQADPEKVTFICSWPTPTSPTELRQWLGMANYLHKYTKNYTGLTQLLSFLLKKGATWDWRPEHREAFDAVKTSLASAPILMLPDALKPFHSAL
ncbi:polyprotein [Phytophthora megakarya]|uniref:Polyprotein n=1 Tax=Phytophthora megakarya TaxID=4795 RepID=A0A225VFW7_9STRA|nr:polyprotein [Phytophthora megakarya]